MTEEPLNQPAEIPAELDRWNWGAFLLNWIWGVGNSVFIALLMFVPFVNFVMLFVLGARGSRWAWRNRAWSSIEQFRTTQRKWAIAGIIVWTTIFALTAAIIVSVSLAMKKSEAYRVTMEMVRADQRVTSLIGEEIETGFWTNGSIQRGGGTGQATLNIPIRGNLATGSAWSHAIRSAGQWDMRVVMVWIEGSQTPVVILNKDNVAIPDGPKL